jgi:hypothetical protein
MEQRMLRGIKERAEGQPLVTTPVMLAARAGWAMVGLAVLGLFLRERRRWPWLLLPVVASLPAILLARDADAGLTAFIATGAILLGALMTGGHVRLLAVLLAVVALLFSMVAPLGVTICGALAWGHRWTALVLLSCAVLVVLLFAPDAYAAFGLLFFATALLTVAGAASRLLTRHPDPTLRLAARHQAV